MSLIKSGKTKTKKLKRLGRKQKSMNYDIEMKSAIAEGDKYWDNFDGELTDEMKKHATAHYVICRLYKEGAHKECPHTKMDMLTAVLDLKKGYKNGFKRG